VATSKSSEKPKLLSAPKSKPKFKMENLFRLILALVLALVGFNFGNTEFFRTYPLFGVSYLAQILFVPAASLIGYYVVPALIYQLKSWFEFLIINTVVEIVSNFWELQSKKIQQQRREKQKVKADSERYKLDELLKTAVVLDTSVLIDGRIVELVRLNFLDMPLIVAQEVIDELHILSDSKETLKRQKGRRGLDIIRDLKRKTNIVVRPIKNGSNGKAGVDKIMVKFCKDNNVKMATLDFNLTKVAEVEGIKVLNINALASSIKTVLLPGEEVAVKIIHEGKEKLQGIGYLQDGTMIVVEDAKDKVGQNIKAVVAKVIQSPAGIIIFCK